MNKIENIYGDGIGYVALVDSMGDDYTPAEDARMSTGKGRLGPEKDAALQNRLMNDAHTSPFEGAIAKIEICMPLFVRAEMDRHRTIEKNGEREGLDEEPIGVEYTPEENMRKWFARNEMSGRYIQMPNDYYHPKIVRGQSKTNMQGDGNAPPVSPEVAREFLERGMKATKEGRDLYNWAVESGIEKGLARIYNPQNQYTKIRYTGSVKNWCDMLFLRLPNVVLWECRVAAENIEKLLQEKFPVPMRQWRENVYEAVRLSKYEAEALSRFLKRREHGSDVDDPDYLKSFESALKKLKVK